MNRRPRTARYCVRGNSAGPERRRETVDDSGSEPESVSVARRKQNPTDVKDAPLPFPDLDLVHESFLALATTIFAGAVNHHPMATNKELMLKCDRCT